MSNESPRGSGDEACPESTPPEDVQQAHDSGESEDGRERLHKFLASTGAGSRRECETFIAQGRVSVNGRTVSKMGVKVDPDRDLVLLDGERVRSESRVYYVLNKPSGYICTNSDERARPRAVDLIKDEKRIYTVGRLDADSTGLVLLTNDGGIANIVCHPRYRIEKRYQVHVRGNVNREQVAKVEAGVWLAEGRSSPATVKPIGRNPKRGETILEMTLFEGRNREIRRVFAKVGLTVRRLQRTSIGPLELGELEPGAYRKLRAHELKFVGEAEQMYRANQAAWDAELPAEERRPRRRPQGQGQAGGDRPRTGRPDPGTPPGRGVGRAPAEVARARVARPWGARGVGRAVPGGTAGPSPSAADVGPTRRGAARARIVPSVRRRHAPPPTARPNTAGGDARTSASPPRGRRSGPRPGFPNPCAPRGDPLRRAYNRRFHAPIAQWIEHRPPEPGIGVRIPVGVPDPATRRPSEAAGFHCARAVLPPRLDTQPTRRSPDGPMGRPA